MLSLCTGKSRGSLLHRAAFFAAVLLAAVPGRAETAAAPNAPLPNSKELLQRALANARQWAAEQQRYECRVTDTVVQTNKQGEVKRASTVVEDQFFVNGIAIDRVLSKDGKNLTPAQVKKQNKRVMKETLKYSNLAKATRATDKQDREIEEVMEAMMLTHGRREIVNGRSILDYEIVPNPGFHARNLVQRVARVMRGTVSIDEKSGQIIDLDIKSAASVKVGGGLLASLNKGFWLHIHNHEEADGVWLNDLAEGSGNARAMLFFHPYFHFKETTGDCRLYTTKAMQVGRATVVK